MTWTWYRQQTAHHPRRSLLCLILLMAIGGEVAGQAQAASDPDALSWGGDLRLRQVFIDDVGLDDQSPIADRQFQRYRGRLWGRYSPTEQLSAEARLMWEGRHYNQPQADQWPVPGFETLYSGGVLFDQLALSLDQPAGLPLSLKLGRQDIILGHGWLVLEGTPLDGSRTIYFDAARATLDLATIDTRLDLIVIDQDATTGGFPRPLNNVIEDQIEQYETGAILYARNRSLWPESDLDAYFIYKQDRADRTPGNIRINNGAPFPSPSDQGEIYTLGLRAEGDLGAAWGLRAEGAYQWGHLNGRDLSAVGFNGRLLYRLQDAHDHRLHADLEYLSGDNPGDGVDQAFDPLWGRWPQWSELMIYQWPLDSRVGQATNLLRLNLGWQAKLHPSSLLTFDYHALFANEESTLTPQQRLNISGDGRFRGHLFTAWLKATLGDHVSGHLVAEYLAPGDFYAESRRDDSYFLRAELVLHW